MAHERRILKGACAGAGYFSRYQYEAWNRIPEVKISAIYNRTRSKAEAMKEEFGIAGCYGDYREMIDAESPDFVDVITSPEAHLEMCEYAAGKGVDIICQKPLAPTYEESERIVNLAREAGVRFMVHENWRWQPWYRRTKRLMDEDVLGEVFLVYFRMRTGDGWPSDAYLARQPFFREYPRLLVYETGVHFIDTFRFLLGEITSVYARLRRLNSAIRGEDSGQIVFGFESRATALLDASRYNETDAANPRYTFGEMRVDGAKGHLLMGTDATIHVKPLGKPTYRVEYPHEDRGFAGDCVYAVQRHFVDCCLEGREFESNGEDYLRTLSVVEAVYESAETGEVVRL